MILRSESSMGAPATIDKRYDTLGQPWHDDYKNIRIDVAEGTIAVGDTLEGRFLWQYAQRKGIVNVVSEFES